jgi:hypothetical protein
MPPRHRPHDRQPQPTALHLARLSSLKAVEHALALFGRDARAVVVHAPAATLQGLHRQFDVLAAVLHRVVLQVANGAAQGLRVALQVHG